jgi:probable HAF family extracellular repeat protein
MTSSKSSVAAVVWLIALMGPVLVQAEEPSRMCKSIARYTVEPLPFTPTIVTPSGVVAGITDLHRAVVWHRETGVEELSVPQGFSFTEPVAVMASGDVLVNAFDDKDHHRAAFTYSNHRFVALAGKQTWAHGMGKPGLIVGEWVPEGGITTQAVFWSGTVPHSIGLCCGGILKAVNERGTVIGEAYDDRGHYHAFSWSASDGQHIIDPADAYSSAVAINNAGHILVQVRREGYLYGDGHLSHLDLAGKSFHRVQGLNNCDVVVGGYGPVAEGYKAFIWSKAQGARDLDSILPADSGWKLGTATAINDRGEIVGSGKLHGAKRGFLLIPQH